MFPFGGFSKRPAQRLDQFFIAHDVESLLQRFEIVGTDENERWATVAGHEDTVVLTFDAVGHLREMRLYFGEREYICHATSIGHNSDLTTDQLEPGAFLAGVVTLLALDESR